MGSDTEVRLEAFSWLESQTNLHGDVLPWKLLLEGFTFRGRRVPLVSQQGIFKPAVLLEIPLSIRTSHEGPYADSFTPDGLVLYKYRGTDPEHRENRGLRQAMEQGKPLVYLHGIVPGKYLTTWPVYIVGDEPSALTFTVAVDDARTLKSPEALSETRPEVAIRRAYLTSIVRRRLHQRAFREHVLKAYREQCAMCRLRHQELLDAAHIIPDREEASEPKVQNGLALCKIHHAAFDQHILGVSPDFEVVVRKDILEEIDGPMLRYGLQELDGTKLFLPKRKELCPEPTLLEERFKGFLEARA